MKMLKRIAFITTLAGISIACIFLQSGCNISTQPSAVHAFHYDRSALPGANPWTSRTSGIIRITSSLSLSVIARVVPMHWVLFKLAMNQINLLQPEFVINVGDNIEGYSREKAELNAEWGQIDTMLKELNMPFFRTTGNHDIANKVAQQVWRERYGTTYYSLVYRDTLFPVLDSEDDSRPPSPPGMKEKIELFNRLQTEDYAKSQAMLEEFMSDKAVITALSKPVEFKQYQIDFIKNTLAQNPKVRWTLLFLREPAWDNPSESIKAIQQLLKERNHTFIAGHMHYCDYDNIDGVEHITMGPTGASFHKEGAGNVDHIMWVTMTEKGPQIGNISLKGLFDRKGLDPKMFGAYDRKKGGKPTTATEQTH